MKNRLLAAFFLTSLAGAATARAGETIPSLRLNSTLGPSLAATFVEEDPQAGMLALQTIADVEAGLAGLKLSLGTGYGWRDGKERAVLAVKASLLQTWTEKLLQLPAATYVGPEIDVFFPNGLSLGVFKRVDAPDWRLTASVVFSF